MKGYVAKVSFDLSKGCSYKYFFKKENAAAWADSKAREMFEHSGMEQETEISEMELKECAMLHCHELVPIEDAICMKCEKIQAEPMEDFKGVIEQELLNEW